MVLADANFLARNILQQSQFADSATLFYDSASTTTINGNWELYTHFCLVNTEFEIDDLNRDELLTINGTMTQGGSLSVSNSSGSLDSMTEVKYWGYYPACENCFQVDGDLAIDGAFDGIVLPVMPVDLGLEIVETQIGSEIGIAIEIVESDAATYDDPDETLIVFEPVDLLAFDVDGVGEDEIVALFDGSDLGTLGYVKVYENF